MRLRHHLPSNKSTQNTPKRSPLQPLRLGKKLSAWVTDYALPTGAVLLFLLLWTKSQSVNLAEHNQYVGALRQLQEQDARINQNLLQLRLGLLNNYDPMVNKQAGIQALHQALASPPSFTSANRQQIQAQVQENQALWEEKNKLIEQFNSRNSILRNSLAYLPLAIENLSNDPAIAPDIATRLNTVLKNVLLFNLSATQENLLKIEQEIEQIEERSRENSDIASALIHANVILEKSLETDELIEQALSIPTRQQGRTLAETYDSRYQQAVRIANLYRFGLYLLLTGLVIAIAASTISKLRTAAANLRKATADAQVANKAKSQFLSNMSHELRTPLNIILGFVQLIARNGSLNPQQQDYLESIDQSGEHLLSLINDVLEMSKIEAGKISLNPNDFNLHGLLESIHTMFQFKAHSKGLQLSLNKAENLPQYVFADESKLRQVLANLVGNAVKFTQAGSIHLRARADSEPTKSKSTPLQNSVILHFEIEDTGSGIPTEDIEGLFDPFVQANNQTARTEGTGLGLPISRRFIEMMGGEISLSSQVGVGSQFVFSVKANTVTERNASPTHQAIIGLAANQPSYRILIAEDASKSRQLLVDLLSPIGFEVKEACNGLEALDIHRTWQPDLIWMDLRMPKMDGYEATRQIKSQAVSPATRQKPIVIALTGSAFASEQRRAIAAGCDDFVCKPFRTETIFKKIANYLEVQYTYATAAASKIDNCQQKQTNTSTKIAAIDLRAMSPRWIEQVHLAATKVNGKEIFRLLEAVPPEHKHLRLGLSQLVASFSFEEIVELTRTH